MYTRGRNFGSCPFVLLEVNMETQDPRPSLLRRVIIDVLPYSATDEQLLEMQDRLGLVPSSLDVLEMERKESDTRIKSMTPLSETLSIMSGYSAEAIAEYFLMQAEDVIDDDDDEDGIPTDFLRNTLVRQNTNVIVTAVHGIVSHLLASGILVFKE
jgi:hypothetical protein